MTHVDRQRRALDVSLLPGARPDTQLPAAGALVLGRLSAVGGAGVRVQLGARTGGRVALTDIHDGPVEDALAGLRAGQFCLAAVLGPDPAAPKAGKRRRDGGGAADADAGGSQLLLSLRPSAGAQCAAHAAAAPAQQAADADAPALADGELQAGQLKQGQRVAGYVKSSGPAGVFVALARSLDARIRWGVDGCVCGAWLGGVDGQPGAAAALVRRSGACAAGPRGVQRQMPARGDRPAGVPCPPLLWPHPPQAQPAGGRLCRVAS